jgi:hypothetical protein
MQKVKAWHYALPYNIGKPLNFASWLITGQGWMREVVENVERPTLGWVSTLGINPLLIFV